MKKIYDKVVEIDIEGKTGGFVDTSYYYHYHYLGIPDNIQSIRIYTDYDKLMQSVAHGDIRGATVDYPVFGNKAYLNFFDGDNMTHYHITRKNFKRIIVRTTYKEVKGYSLKDLYERLSADEFLQYCADRNEHFLNTLNGGNNNV